MTRIFDNIETHMGAHLLKTFETSNRMDAAVGYFNLRGWKLFGDVIRDRQAIGEPIARVLVGMTHQDTEDRVIGHLQEQLQGIKDVEEIDREIAITRRQQAKLKFRTQLMRGVPNESDQEALRELRSQLADGRVHIRLFTRRPLHGKTYLCHRTDINNPIIGFVGSSNLTVAGLTNNYELNVDVMDSDGAEKLDKWFMARWEDTFTIDITSDLIEIIDESWASEDLLSPYEVYLKVCWHLSRDVREGLMEYSLPASMRNQLLEYQESAVKTLSRRIMTRGGAMLGDVVGLGKTITAVATALMLNEAEGYRALVICPKNLVQMWEEYLDAYEIPHKVESYSMSAKNLPKLGRYQFVIIDESHTMRSDKRQDYQAIYDYIRTFDSKVLLLTATPYNIRFKDVGNQLGLYIDPDDDIGLQPLAAMAKDSGFVERLDGKVNTLEAFNRSEEPDDWKRLMSEHLIRRTRSFVKNNYAKKDENGVEYLEFSNGTRFTFPTRIPKPVEHSFGASDPAAIMASDGTLDTIDGLHLPRYNLAAYLKKNVPLSAPEKEIVERLERGSGHLLGFVRSGLYKRLSSCGYSFEVSLNRHIARNELYLYAIEHELDLPLGTLLDPMLSTAEVDIDAENDLDVTLGDQVAASDQSGYEALKKAKPKYVRWVRTSLFTSSLLEHIKADTKALRDLMNTFGDWTQQVDSKLDALVKLTAETHPTDKVLVFTEYKDTADYVARSLKERGVSNVGVATGETDNPTDVARRFSPVSNTIHSATLSESELDKLIAPENEIRVLVSTDVLSEGQNLQDAHIVVNYDLPWAIIRLIQRAGRVDRVGQKSSEVLIYSFFHENVENVLNLRSRIAQRLHTNAEVFGSDEQFFGSAEETKVIEDLYKGHLDDAQVDSDVDASSLAYEVWNNAEANYKAITEKVVNLPDMVYATRGILTPKDVTGVLCYIRTETGMDSFGFGSTTELGLLTGQEAVARFACEPDTAPLPAQANHFPLVLSLAQGPLTQSNTVEGRLRGVRKRIWTKLNGSLVASQLEVAEALEAIFRASLTREAEQRFASAFRLRPDVEDLADLLVLLHRDKRLVRAEIAGDDPIRVVCSMGIAQ
ncbi:NgoFVII family restriction endonuclease [Cryobacterium melibiosiphilum]|uniref:NgoFVII family restriction endonuclease n=1 Tax=Cryobacterium melibiosiphilum TaxID=995039 RepID=A0A3A5MMG7_9MICO|nr:helicase-related protein [Cryobacterium melibiosiphilum]RJT90211.1 NgoFVII family restriction endonuclease [Cryobacterium melibiosiphilum]